ncbi:MAG: PKD domain-containing protein [Thermoplasmataceae archaeon]
MRGIAAAILLAFVMAAPIGMVPLTGGVMPVHGAQPILAAASPSHDAIAQVSRNATADMITVEGNPAYTSPTGIKHAFILSPAIGAASGGGHLYDSGYSVAGITFASWNGTIDMRIGGELMFMPGYDASNYASLGTAWANVSYGNATLSWSHAFDEVYTGSAAWCSIAPEWNATAPLYERATLNVTLTADPGEPWRYSSNAPYSLVSHAVPLGGNSMDALPSGGYPVSAIPASGGYMTLTYAQPVVSLQAGFSAAFPGENSSYVTEWIFSDGSTASGVEVNRTFTNAGVHQVSVNVSFGGGWDVHYFNVTVNIYVSISDSVSSGMAPLQEDFYSSALGASSYSYMWDFGNGNTSVNQDPSQAFSAGNYSVTLQVRSPGGATGSASLSVVSLPAPATVSYAPGKDITVLTTVTFTLTPSWDAPGPYNVTWEFPNGQALAGLTVSYRFPVYEKSSPVDVTLDYGDGKSWSGTVTVGMVPATPRLEFSPPHVVPEGTVIRLNASATAPDSGAFSYSWEIGGQSYTGNAILYYFNSSGNYSVSVTVTDGLGASSSMTAVIDSVLVTSSSTITISDTRTVSGPYVYYAVEVQSIGGISVAEAFLGPESIGMPETNASVSGTVTTAYYNITLDQRDYQAGTYPIGIDVFNTNGQSNSRTIEFTVSSRYAIGSFDIVALFGGLPNFIMVLVTIAAAITGIVAARPRPEYMNIGGSTFRSTPGKPLTQVKRKR